MAAVRVRRYVAFRFLRVVPPQKPSRTSIASFIEQLELHVYTLIIYNVSVAPVFILLILPHKSCSFKY